MRQVTDYIIISREVDAAGSARGSGGRGCRASPRAIRLLVSIPGWEYSPEAYSLSRNSLLLPVQEAIPGQGIGFGRVFPARNRDPWDVRVLDSTGSVYIGFLYIRASEESSRMVSSLFWESKWKVDPGVRPRSRRRAPES